MTAVTPPETPLMQQYREIKARYPQTILFFRMGDFYEMFEDDAKLAARELGLTLTSRNNGGAAEVPLAGVPVKAATEYLRRLIAKGHRVAIAEQIEDPKLAKGVVRRAVVETVTPGTVLSDDWLIRNRNNYVVAVDPRGDRHGPRSVGIRCRTGARRSDAHVRDCVPGRTGHRARRPTRPRRGRCAAALRPRT